MKTNFDVHIIHEDTPIQTASLRGKPFIAFSPYPKGVKSKAAWVSICPNNACVARSLQKTFGEIADILEAKGKL